MKIIIHYQEDITKTVDFTVSTLSNLINLISVYPDEDIEGEIRPSAKNNPQLQDILQTIYDHKLRLWKTTDVSSNRIPYHEKFLLVLEKHGIELKHESQVCVKTWVGTLDNYDTIPVKDPKTMYTIIR